MYSKVLTFVADNRSVIKKGAVLVGALIGAVAANMVTNRYATEPEFDPEEQLWYEETLSEPAPIVEE
jgi:hypothetical protein